MSQKNFNFKNSVKINWLDSCQLAWKAIRKDEDFTEDYFKYDVGYIKDKVKSIKSSLKIPIFCSVIKSIDTTSGLDPSCELIDSNGTILANIHRDVIENHGNQLKPGMYKGKNITIKFVY